MPPNGGPAQDETVDLYSMSDASARTPGSRKEDWIASQFRRVYNDALEESIPPEMLNLINAIDERGAEDGAEDEGEKE